MFCLGDAVLIRDHIRPLGLHRLLHVRWQVQVCKLLFPFLQNSKRIDYFHLVENIFRPISEEPKDDQVNNNGDPEDLPQAGTSTLILQLIHDLKQLVPLKVLVLLSSASSWRLWGSTRWIGWDFGNGHSETVQAAGRIFLYLFILSHRGEKSISLTQREEKR